MRVERITKKKLRNNILNNIDTIYEITYKNMFGTASGAFQLKYKYQIEFCHLF